MSMADIYIETECPDTSLIHYFFLKKKIDKPHTLIEE